MSVFSVLTVLLSALFVLSYESVILNPVGKPPQLTMHVSPLATVRDSFGHALDHTALAEVSVIFLEGNIRYAVGE